MREVGHVDIVSAGVDGITAPLIIFFSRRAKVPIDELEIRRVAHELPTDHTAGVHEMDLFVLVVGDLFLVETRCGETFQRIHGTTLQ